MKFTSFIATLLMSSALIQGATADEGQNRTESPSEYHVVHASSEEHPKAKKLMFGSEILETVYFDTVIRQKSEYHVCTTDNPLSHAFVPNTPETLEKWQNVTSFLVESMAAGLECAKEYQQPQEVKTRSRGGTFLSELLKMAKRIHSTCMIAGYIPEGMLNSFYQYVWGIVAEREHANDPLSKDLIDNMYVPIKEWIKASLPICSMYEFVDLVTTPELNANGLINISLLFQGEKYYYECFPKTDEYSKILRFSKKDTSLYTELQRDFVSFRNASSEEMLKKNFPENRIDIKTKSIMSYVRFLESIKDAERALVSKWMGKINEESQKGLRPSAHKAANVRGKKPASEELLAHMMKELGLEDEMKPSSRGSRTTRGQKSPNPTGEKAKAKMPSVDSHQVDMPCAPHEKNGVASSPKSSSASAFPDKVEKPSRKTSPPAVEITEEERERNLAENEAAKAEQRAALEARKQMLLERREAQAAADEQAMSAFQHRAQKTWVESAFGTKLDPFSSSSLIDSSIFAGSPDFDETMKALVASGVYVNTNVHGNEKGVARWVGKDGNKEMVWFDRPHGAQLKMGAAAGWFKSLVKRLRETGKLAE